jgi:hypothetical protein
MAMNKSWPPARRSGCSSLRPRAGVAAVMVGLLLSAGCASQGPTVVATGPGQPGPGKTDDFLVVDCLLPPQVRQLGQHFTYLAPRQAIKTSARDCEIRGGEYVAYDRANYATALKVWLPQAEQGDPNAQTYVGEIFEKGLGVAPDYAAAATWYERAAKQNFPRAAINLGNLYEQGLGVPKDPAQALNWYRRAAGLPQVSFEPAPGKPPGELRAMENQIQNLNGRLQDKQRDLDKSEKELEQLQQKLEAQEEEIDSLKKGPPSSPSSPGRNTGQGGPAPASVRNPEMQALLSAKEKDVKELSDQIQRLRSGSGDRSKAIATIKQELDQTQTDVRALRAGLQPGKHERLDNGPLITFDRVQLVEPAIFTPTRGVEPTQLRVPTATRSWIVDARVTSVAGLRSLSINNRSQSTNRDNVFQVSLRATDRQLLIVAVDRQGRSSTLVYRLPDTREGPARRDSESVALTPVQVSQLSRSIGAYHALVIGNDRYQHLPPLRTAVNDAQAVARILREQYRFQVKLLTDSTGYALLQALDELRGTLTEKDNLLIYYAGHGEMDSHGRGYWLPADAQANDSGSWIANDKITGILDAMPVRQVLLVADSCYSGTLARTALGQPESVKTQDEMVSLLLTLAKKRSRIAMTSGRLEPVLDSGGGPHSVFADAFIKTLRANHGVLLGQDFFRQVQLQVADVAGNLPLAPEPQYAPIHPGYEAGDFVFVRPAS